MRTSKLAALSVVVLLWARCISAAPANVQACSQSVAAVTSVTCTMTTTAGNAAIVNFLVTNHSKAGAGTIAQTSGDTCTIGTPTVEIDNGGSYLGQCANYNIAGGSTTYTFTTTVSSNLVLFVEEASGLLTSSAFDTGVTTTQVTAASIATGTTATLAQASEFCLASWNGDGTGSGKTFSSLTNGYVIPTNGDQINTSNGPGAIAYVVTSATTAQTTTMTFAGGNVAATTVLGCYKGAGGGCTPSLTLLGVARCG